MVLPVPVKEHTIDFNKYIGIRYKYTGTDSNGYDCSGFVRELIKCEERYSYDIYIHNKNKYPLIYFRGYGISHIGYLINDSTMIHCDSKGVNIMSLNSKEYKRYYAKIKFE